MAALQEYYIPSLLSGEDLDLDLLLGAGSSQVETRIRPPPGFRDGDKLSIGHYMEHLDN